MLIPLNAVPRYERHLLYCTGLSPPRRRRFRQRRSVRHTRMKTPNGSRKMEQLPVVINCPETVKEYAWPGGSVPT
jgi:hypothetical protein